jgi:uncharacterized protein YigA (DUF484 family)
MEFYILTYIHCSDSAQNLTTQLEEVEQENEQLRKINDLIMRQSNLNAAEAAKVEKLNNELVSQRNPAQKVKILDRMRREIKEEREVRWFLITRITSC